MGTPSMGHQAKAASDVALPFDVSSEPFEFESEDVKRVGSEIDSAGIRGTRQHFNERTRDGLNRYGGPLTVCFTPTLASQWLKRIQGDNVTGSDPITYNPAETIPSFWLMFDRVAKVFQYNSCKVNRAEFICSPGQILKCNLDIKALSETVTNAGTFPALTMPTDAPYIFADGTITIQGSSRTLLDIRVTVDNVVEERYAAGSNDPSALNEGDRIIKVSCRNPFTSDETDLYNQASNAAISLAFTNGTKSLTFNLAAVKFPPMSPTVRDKKEIPLMLEGTSRRTSGTAYDLQFINDIT